MPRILGVYCTQATDIAPSNLFDFASDYSSRAVKLRLLLELDDSWIWRYETLSHGEKKRLQVACALVGEPLLVALDEPTNHLDAQTREVLLETLRQYRGVGLIVSHDRAFLDGLVYQCLFLDEGRGDLIPGNYTQAKTNRDTALRSAQAERHRAKESLARIQSEAARRKAEANRSAKRRSGKDLGKHDSDGREKLRLAVVSGQDGKAGLLSAQMDKKIGRAQKRLDEARVKKIYDKPLSLQTTPSKRKYVAHMSAACISLGDDHTLHYPELFIGPRERIGLRGRNGAGKSTFLELLLSQPENELDGTSLYIPQEINPRQAKAMLADLKDLAPAEKGQVLSVVARLNSPPDRLLSGDDLSPGELRKVMFALGLLRSPHIIVMDEPTNHLDIRSIEALQDVLQQCCCALVLVSHDEAFLNDLVDIAWEFRSELEGETTTTKLVVNWDFGAPRSTKE